MVTTSSHKAPMRLYSITVLFLAFSLWSYARTSVAHADSTSDDFQSWWLVNTTIPFEPTKTVGMYLEAQSRFGDDSSDLERLLLRSGLTYGVTPAFSLTVGYAWTPTYINQSYASELRNERRVWEQLTYSHGDEWKFFHRLRQEQRDIQRADSPAHRTRYLLRASKELALVGENSGGTGYLEYFLNWNSVTRGPTRGWDRTRLFVGPYFQLGSSRIEVGYIGEYGNHFAGQNRLIQGILTSLTVGW